MVERDWIRKSRQYHRKYPNPPVAHPQSSIRESCKGSLAVVSFGAGPNTRVHTSPEEKGGSRGGGGDGQLFFFFFCVAFSSRARILGECSTSHSLLALFSSSSSSFFFLKWRLDRAHQFHSH